MSIGPAASGRAAELVEAASAHLRPRGRRWSSSSGTGAMATRLAVPPPFDAGHACRRARCGTACAKPAAMPAHAVQAARRTRSPLRWAWSLIRWSDPIRSRARH